MRIQARLRMMAANEISQMIPPARLREIKLTDPRPVFKAFVVGHEGEARGNMLGVGNIVKRWFRSAVEKLHEKISAGLQLFHGHGETNDSAGREAIGEVVGKKAMGIGGRLSSVVACYIYPNFRHLPLDVASIEADVQLDQDRTRGLYVADVDKVTGIALGNSAIETPGFTGATLLGQLQAFAKSKNIGDELMDITIEDVKSFLKAEKVQPSDVFGVDVITSDPAVKGYVETETRRAVAGEYAHRKRTEEGFDKTREEFEKRATASEALVTQLRLDAAKGQVGGLFAKQAAERKLTDQQAKFVQARLTRFSPSKVEEVGKEFNSYLDAEIDEYGRLAKDVFGVEEKKAEGDNGKHGAEPGAKPESPTLNPYLDPAKNPFIKLD
jgi:hypothetical protein